MKRKFLVLVILVVLLVSGWAPPPPQQNGASDDTFNAATTYSLIVTNKNKETIKLKLSGPTTYNFDVKPGKQTFKVQGGTYKYSYKVCNANKTGTVVVNKNNVKLNLAVCKQKSGEGKEVKVTIQNNTGGYIRLVLVGPKSYNFSLPAGKNVITVVQGKYTYTVYGCGGSSLTRTVNLKQGKVITFFCL